jgi:hypothetical protein
MEFEAKSINIAEEYGAIVVGLVDDESSPSRYVLLQRTLGPDEQDRALGHDRVHLQVNSESKSGYSDVEEAVLSRDRLSLRFNQETARRIGIDDVIEIRLAAPGVQLTALEAACRKLFDEQCFRVA